MELQNIVVTSSERLNWAAAESSRGSIECIRGGWFIVC